MYTFKMRMLVYVRTLYKQIHADICTYAILGRVHMCMYSDQAQTDTCKYELKDSVHNTAYVNV